jgi:N-methylhydantoinase A
MRYAQQVHEVYVNALDGFYTQETADELVAEFEREYARVYGDTSVMIGANCDVNTLIVKAHAEQRSVDIARGGEAKSGLPQKKGEREVIWYEMGLDPVRTPTYDGASFVAGMSVGGPAIVEYPDTTLVIRGSQVARVSETGSVVVDINVEERNS